MDLATHISRAAQGDAGAFGKLVERYRGLVFAICLNEVGHVAASEDLTQDVFLRVFTDLKELRDPEKLLPWLRAVARNACRMWRRRQPAIPVPLEVIAGHEDQASASWQKRVELWGIVSSMLAQLSPRSREALVLRYLAGCSEGEIAAALGLKPATVKSRLHEARMQARRTLLPVVNELLSWQIPSQALVQQIIEKCGNPDCVCARTLIERG